MRPALALLLWVLCIPVFILSVALLMTFAPLPPPFPPAGSGARNLPAAICTGFAGLVYLAAFAGWVVWAFRRAGRILEPTLIGQGFSAGSHLFWGRRYAGSLQGRRVEVRYLPPKAPGPGLLEVEVGAQIPQRAAVGRGRPLLDLRDKPAIPLDACGLEKLVAVASDDAWLKALLAAPGVVPALRGLFPANPRSFREVYFRPGGLWYRHHPRGEAAEELPRILEALLDLADAAEKRP